MNIGPRLVDVCPEYAEALDKFEAEPTDENWQAVLNAAWEFQRKIRRIERADA